MSNHLYHYACNVTDVYDGDTITVDIDLGFGTILKDQKIRLFEINTPEIRGKGKEAGLHVRELVEEKLTRYDPDIMIQTVKSTKKIKNWYKKEKKGKYGRWLGIIYYRPDRFGQQWINLNQELKDMGYEAHYG